MEINNLDIGYKQPLIKGISLSLVPGLFVCLTGRNGTGKSTLLKTLSGLIAPLRGQVMLDDQDLRDMNPSTIARKIGLVLTHVPELNNTSLRELVIYGRLPYSSWTGKFSERDRAIADAAIARLGISHLADRSIQQLSDGERQKGMIARALAQGTEYLLLDEPSAFLDYESRLELMALLVKLAHEEHKAILLSTHDLELADQYADIIWRVQDGEVKTIKNK